MQSINDAGAEFAARREREQRRHYARRPKKIGDVLAQLFTSRGYGRVQADGELDCRPCHEPVCRLGHHRCMREIPAARLIALAQAALANASKASA